MSKSWAVRSWQILGRGLHKKCLICPFCLKKVHLSRSTFCASLRTVTGLSLEDPLNAPHNTLGVELAEIRITCLPKRPEVEFKSRTKTEEKFRGQEIEMQYTRTLKCAFILLMDKP